MLEFLFNLFIEFLLWLPFRWWPFNQLIKLERVINELSQEEWFKELDDDYRYSFILRNNKKVIRTLLKPGSAHALKYDIQVQEQFIKMVKDEHVKFVGLS
ncbi:hypothetical protein [Desulforamulus aquiferis]|uniref:Uncharacterized protein n=1 Tax=Desulforamulus aquiferis TaxID=1397668 RepID=A0AAW7ZGH5_9FIRM|nr:hypothetical protein [Desulforamulus aquiferis]MDO7788798.1 hypothetical protein [Desulforamulus aquiferis]